ncbi:hypothetical protein BDF21DRAFT_428338 [Thamnidium elegans]|nr:hypothetical protein BDF21DRAFT_428338 [Thamnidium elegans]
MKIGIKATEVNQKALMLISIYTLVKGSMLLLLQMLVVVAAFKWFISPLYREFFNPGKHLKSFSLELKKGTLLVRTLFFF